MKQNLNQFFESNKNNRLDSHTKNFLYNKISNQIHKKYLFSNNFVKRSKLISVSFIIALFFSTLQYSITKTDLDWVFISYLKTIQTAQADYIGSIISWDGTYQIILNNKIVNTSQTNNRIPDWGSIIIKDNSKVFVKTNNNATANIVGPAKITFQKQNNQLVVDIAYIDHIDIKKDRPSMKGNITQNEELVVKTESKTIVAKSNARDISLINNGENNIIKNNNGEIAITSNFNNSIIALQTDESIILDDEVKLFSIKKENTNPVDNKNTITVNSWKDNFNNILENESITLTLNKENTNDLVKTSLLDEDKTIIKKDTDTKISSDGKSISDEWIQNIDQNIDTVTDIKTNQNTEISLPQETLVEEEKDIIENKDYLYLMQENIKQPQSWSIINSSNSLDVILVSKKLLTPELLQLLKTLNINYYKNNKDLSKVSTIIKQLCDELKISCLQKDLLYDLNKVNQKLVEWYIITSDIKLVR